MLALRAARVGGLAVTGLAAGWLLGWTWSLLQRNAGGPAGQVG